MIDVAVLGSTALDDIKSPFGQVKKALGGSAIYSALAASFFCQPGLISCYGEDLPKKYLELLKSKSIDLTGFQKVEGRTFHWQGEYTEENDDAITLSTQLNSLLKLSGEVPEEYRKAKHVLLANIDPELQLKVLEQFSKPRFVIADTMNYWIKTKKNKVLEVIEKADVTLMNGYEARMLFQTKNLVHAFKHLLSKNSEFAIIKKGEHGSMMFSKDKKFIAPAYPLENLKDPTGAGDTFAGALIGFLSKKESVNEKALRQGMIYASAMASMTVEGFSVEKLKKSSKADVKKRFQEFKELVFF